MPQDDRINSSNYDDIKSLIEDIRLGKSKESINEVIRSIESLWRNEFITVNNFNELYKLAQKCKKQMYLDRLSNMTNYMNK